jgi:hypothetical protein
MILTAGIIVMLIVAMGFANNILNTKMAVNELETNQQFLTTTGKQIDDIAWIIGRTQTILYSSRFGQIVFEPSVINYTIEAKISDSWVNVGTFQTGIILFNMPTSVFAMNNSYFERFPYTANGSFLQRGASAPIDQVFSTQKGSMSDGSYLRVVVVPTIRALSSANYSKFYLPTLDNGTHLYRSQSITLSGNGIERFTKSGVDQVRINATFPKAALGFDADFFQFDHLSETETLPADSVVGFYVGEVTVTIGQV